MPYEDVIQGSLKRETRIDSTDSARPAATIADEPPQFAQGGNALNVPQPPPR